MYPYRYYRELLLPKLPAELIEKINFNIDEYTFKSGYFGTYHWSDSFNQEINAWCQSNICPEMYFAFQFLTDDLIPHCDDGTKTKLVYLLDTGGDNVITSFYADDAKTVMDHVKLKAHTWYLLKVDAYHGAQGIEPGRTRFAISSRAF